MASDPQHDLGTEASPEHLALWKRTETFSSESYATPYPKLPNIPEYPKDDPGMEASPEHSVPSRRTETFSSESYATPDPKPRNIGDDPMRQCKDTNPHQEPA